MQAHTPEVSAEKATTPADQRLVSVEQLKKIHRDLNACQKVIWLAGCGPRGYGFDQSYVTDAQERLKELDTLIAEPAPVQDGQQTVYVECRECSGCGHVGINDSLEKNAACSRCAWIGPSPAEDTCPGCAADNVMSAACPKCGCIYRLLTDAEIYAPVAQTEQPEQSDWISVEDRLPDGHKAEYLCLFGDGHQQVSEWLHDETEGWVFWYGDPTHWLPLPAAPAMAAKAVRNE